MTSSSIKRRQALRSPSRRRSSHRYGARPVLRPRRIRTRPDLQRLGARVALTRRVAVLAGGPGTGKTHTVARTARGPPPTRPSTPSRPLRVALAAPTGKAAARMTEAVHQAVASADLPAASVPTACWPARPAPSTGSWATATESRSATTAPTRCPTMSW